MLFLFYSLFCLSDDFFSANYRKRNVYIFVLISILCFNVLASFLLNADSKLNQEKRMENKTTEYIVLTTYYVICFQYNDLV